MTKEEFSNIDWKKQKIEIKCKGAETLPLDSIEDFQGNLKKRGKKEINQILKSIIDYGFSFPFYVWNGEGHNYCIDGHGRISALTYARSKGCELPWFPVIYVEAENEEEAKQKLLRLNSQYGTMSKSSVADFIGDIKIDYEDIALPSGLIDFEKKTEEEDLPEEEFTEEIGEENNYLVLFFDNSIDWLQVESLFELKTVKALKSTESFQQKGIGRVINGTKFLKKMIESERGEK